MRRRSKRSEIFILYHRKVEVYFLNEVKLGREVLTQRVNFNPVLPKNEAVLDNFIFPELHNLSRP